MGLTVSRSQEIVDDSCWSRCVKAGDRVLETLPHLVVGGGTRGEVREFIEHMMLRAIDPVQTKRLCKSHAPQDVFPIFSCARRGSRSSIDTHIA